MMKQFLPLLLILFSGLACVAENKQSKITVSQQGVPIITSIALADDRFTFTITGSNLSDVSRVQLVTTTTEGTVDLEIDAKSSSSITARNVTVGLGAINVLINEVTGLIVTNARAAASVAINLSLASNSIDAGPIDFDNLSSDTSSSSTKLMGNVDPAYTGTMSGANAALTGNLSMGGSLTIDGGNGTFRDSAVLNVVSIVTASTDPKGLYIQNDNDLYVLDNGDINVGPLAGARATIAGATGNITTQGTITTTGGFDVSAASATLGDTDLAANTELTIPANSYLDIAGGAANISTGSLTVFPAATLTVDSLAYIQELEIDGASSNLTITDGNLYARNAGASGSGMVIADNQVQAALGMVVHNGDLTLSTAGNRLLFTDATVAYMDNNEWFMANGSFQLDDGTGGMPAAAAGTMQVRNNIVTVTGGMTSANAMTAVTGNITATAGDIVATAGNITSVGAGNIQATGTGNIIVNSGDFTNTSGNASILSGHIFVSDGTGLGATGQVPVDGEILTVGDIILDRGDINLLGNGATGGEIRTVGTVTASALIITGDAATNTVEVQTGDLRVQAGFVEGQTVNVTQNFTMFTANTINVANGGTDTFVLTNVNGPLALEFTLTGIFQTSGLLYSARFFCHSNAAAANAASGCQLVSIAADDDGVTAVNGSNQDWGGNGPVTRDPGDGQLAGSGALRVSINSAAGNSVTLTFSNNGADGNFVGGVYGSIYAHSTSDTMTFTAP